MQDNELRGILLREYYDRRRKGKFQWCETDFDPGAAGFETTEDFFRICDQLGEHGLIDWHPVRQGTRSVGGLGMISAFGVDVIEGSAKSPITILLDQSRHVSVNQSSHVQVGDNNAQCVSVHIAELLKAIDHSSESDEAKFEAKSLLKRFLEHPLVSAIAGGLASSIK